MIAPALAYLQPLYGLHCLLKALPLQTLSPSCGSCRFKGNSMTRGTRCLRAGCSAEKCGVIRRGDEIVAVGEEGMREVHVEGAGLEVLRHHIMGAPGTFVQLFFRRGRRGEYQFDVELMRGTPEYIETVQGGEIPSQPNRGAPTASSPPKERKVSTEIPSTVQDEAAQSRIRSLEEQVTPVASFTKTWSPSVFHLSLCPFLFVSHCLSRLGSFKALLNWFDCARSLRCRSMEQYASAPCRSCIPLWSSMHLRARFCNVDEILNINLLYDAAV